MIEIIQTLLLFIILFYLYTLKKNENKSGSTSKDAMVLDSCALIDGRILPIAEAGFTPSQLIVPRFVVRELQMLADGNDSHKRERARFGLDIVQELQNIAHCNVRVSDIDFDDIQKTDDKLVRLASKLSATLCTTDYNLNKVATIEGVQVLNVNELANALRAVALPGEKKQIKIVQKGSNKDQGVGYLDDGTMIVVAGGGRMIGKQVTVEVTRMIQTEAGKMLFAKTIQRSNKNHSKLAK